MSTLGFDNYVEPLKLYLQKYREAMKGERQPGDGFEEIDDVICKCMIYHFFFNWWIFYDFFSSKFSAASGLQNIAATDGSGNQVLLTYSGSQTNMQSFQLSWSENPCTIEI